MNLLQPRLSIRFCIIGSAGWNQLNLYELASCVIDGVEEMEALGAQATKGFESSAVIRNLIRWMLATMFYVELDPTLKIHTDDYAFGEVLCMWKINEKGFEELRRYLMKLQPVIYLNNRLQGTLDEDNDGKLSYHLKMAATDLTRQLSVQIRLGDDEPRHINGSPTSLATLV